MNKYLFIFLSMLLSACAQIQIDTHDLSKPLSQKPSLEDNVDYYFLGFLEPQYLNLKRLCGDQSVQKIETLTSFEDGLIAVFTLGIYTPKTYRIWCTEEGG